jgi:hypothetical protein
MSDEERQRDPAYPQVEAVKVPEYARVRETLGEPSFTCGG